MSPSHKAMVAAGFGSEAGVAPASHLSGCTLCEVAAGKLGGNKSEDLRFRPSSAPNCSELWASCFPLWNISFSLCDIRRLDR